MNPKQVTKEVLSNFSIYRDTLMKIHNDVNSTIRDTFNNEMKNRLIYEYNYRENIGAVSFIFPPSFDNNFNAMNLGKAENNLFPILFILPEYDILSIHRECITQSITNVIDNIISTADEWLKNCDKQILEEQMKVKKKKFYLLSLKNLNNIKNMRLEREIIKTNSDELKRLRPMFSDGLMDRFIRDLQGKISRTLGTEIRVVDNFNNDSIHDRLIEWSYRKEGVDM